MKSLKRLFVAFVAAAMMLTAMATGFAAPFTDVVGQKFESSVSMLQQLGVFVGKGDGTFGYSEKVTRAEMAAILVKLAGFSGEIEAAKNSEAAFADVANHWSKGEVNVAYQHGLIAGVGDGKFNPDGNVTYGEVITMIMKLLGYGPVVDGKGVWPYNYIAKSAEKGIELYDGVSIAATSPATRGDIAKIADNALTAKPLVVTGYNEYGNPTYGYPSDKADPGEMSELEESLLLYKVFDAVKFENSVVTRVPAMTTDPTDTNKVTLVPKAAGAANALDETIEIAQGVVDDINSLLYMEVSGIYFYDKEEGENRILSIVSQTKSSNIIQDTVKDITFNGDDLTKIEFNKVGSKDVAADPDIVINFSEVDESQFKSVVMSGDDIINDTIKITAVTNKDGKIDRINAWIDKRMSLPGGVEVYSNIVRDKGSNEVAVLKDKDGDYDDEVAFYNKDIQEGIDKKGVKAFVIRNGKAATMNDLAEGDTITIVAKGSKSKFGTHEVQSCYYVVASSEKAITGKKIDAIIGTSINNLKLVIDGVQYTVASGLSYNKATSGDIDDSTFLLSKKDISELSDFLTEPANFAMNSNGQITYIESVNMIASANETTSLVVAAENKNVDGESRLEVTLLKADGTFTTMYTSDTVKSADRSKYDEGDLIKYKINRKGEIDITTVTSYSGGTITVNEDYDLINGNAVNSGTVFYSLSLDPADYTPDEWDNLSYSDKYQTTTWETVRDIYDAGNPILPSGSAIYTKDGQVKAVFINGVMESGDVQEGLIVYNGVNSDGVYVKLFVGGNERQYKLDTDTAIYATNGNFVGLRVSGSTVELVGNGDEYLLKKTYSNDNELGDVYRAKIDAADSTSFTVRHLYMNSIDEVSEDGTYYTLTYNSDVKVYDATDKNNVKKITINDLKKDDYFYCRKDGNGKVTTIVKINKNDLHTTLNTRS